MVHVAVGVIFNVQRQVLVALRQRGRHLAGFWEFPGGKREENETIIQTLQRELSEELGIWVQDAEPLLTKQHHYENYSVLLDVWSVLSYTGKPTGREGQQIAWHFPQELTQLKFPEANQVIIEKLLYTSRRTVVIPA